MTSRQNLIIRQNLCPTGTIRYRFGVGRGFEEGQVDTRISTMSAIEKALSKAGIEFLPADAKGEGVRLKNPRL